MHAQKTAQIIDGKATAAFVRENLKVEVDDFVKRGFRRPGLAVVLIGDDPASHVYVKNKVQACQKVGIESQLFKFVADVTADVVFACLKSLNEDPAVDGILVQLPLPAHLPTEAILEYVSSDKDADGLHPYNLGLLLGGKPGPRPCTPQGVMVLLERYNLEVSGKHAVVIGRSILVGKPAAIMLTEKNATVTICHSKTKNLEAVAASADILVVAAGRAEMVKGSWVKPGAVVIDVGTNRVQLPSGESKLVGDVAYAEAAAVASHITPVPGGVGPMTIAMLLSNTFKAYQGHIIPFKP